MAKAAKSGPGGKVMAVRVVSRRANFRRCGVSHGEEPVVHPPGTFSRAQIETLKGERMLVVDLVEWTGDDGADEPGTGDA